MVDSRRTLELNDCQPSKHDIFAPAEGLRKWIGLKVNGDLVSFPFYPCRTWKPETLWRGLDSIYDILENKSQLRVEGITDHSKLMTVSVLGKHRNSGTNVLTKLLCNQPGTDSPSVTQIEVGSGYRAGEERISWSDDGEHILTRDSQLTIRVYDVNRDGEMLKAVIPGSPRDEAVLLAEQIKRNQVLIVKKQALVNKLIVEVHSLFPG